MKRLYLKLGPCPKNVCSARKTHYCQRQLVVNLVIWDLCTINKNSAHEGYSNPRAHFVQSNKLSRIKVYYVKARPCPKSTCGANKTHYCRRLLVVNLEIWG